MQFLGFTLATKQPSMTAAALAKTIKDSKGEHQLDDLVVLIARISRSQFAAAIGNVFTVVPVVIVLDLLWVATSGHHFLNEEAARTSVASFDPIHSGTIFFAALTGMLLWVSSLGAGWLENWVTYRRLPEAIRHHRLGRVVGRDRLAKVADFVANHSAGIGGNVTLGFLLAMVPVFGAFFGLPLEVRHITLSTGTLTFAGCTLGAGAISVSACIGIALIGLLNFGVSFAFALAVAFRAREVSARERVGLAVSVWKAFLRQPLRFFYPPKNITPIAQDHPH
jgi:site-specific recombinase